MTTAKLNSTKTMKKVLGCALLALPFFGLAAIAGQEALIAAGVTAAVVASVFGGCYLLSKS